MEIKWLGHACFQIKTKAATLVIDPYKEIGLSMPKVTADILLITHEHFDHNAREKVKAEVTIDGPGEYEFKGIYIEGVKAFHDDKQGAERGTITMYLIRTDEITLLHAGDLGHRLDSKLIEEINGVDVLLIPVGGKYTLDAKGAAEVAKDLSPRIVIPMHYKIPKLTLDIAGAEAFIKEMGLEPEKTNVLKVSRSQLPEEEMRLVVLSPNI